MKLSRRALFALPVVAAAAPTGIASQETRPVIPYPALGERHGGERIASLKPGDTVIHSTKRGPAGCVVIMKGDTVDIRSAEGARIFIDADGDITLYAPGAIKMSEVHRQITKRQLDAELERIERKLGEHNARVAAVRRA